MRVSERLELINRIGRELQARYSYSDIDVVLKNFGIEPPIGESYNSKWLYSKEALKPVSDGTLVKIAKELDLDIMPLLTLVGESPRPWKDNDCFRLFLSHLAVHKDKATRLKVALGKYHINAFVAHEDIEPTREWQKEIERALLHMDAMLTIHTKGFSQSVWTQQEIGFALGRNIKVIAFKFEETPSGFIAKEQAVLRRGRDAEGVAEEINTLLINDPKTKTRMAEILSKYQTIEDDEIPF